MRGIILTATLLAACGDAYPDLDGDTDGDTDIDTESETETETETACQDVCTFTAGEVFDLAEPLDVATLMACGTVVGTPMEPLEIMLSDAGAIDGVVPDLGCLMYVEGSINLIGGDDEDLVDVVALAELYGIESLTVTGWPNLDPCPLLLSIWFNELDVDDPCIHDNGANLASLMCPDPDWTVGC